MLYDVAGRNSWSREVYFLKSVLTGMDFSEITNEVLDCSGAWKINTPLEL